MKEKQIETKRILLSLIFPLSFVVLLWIVKIIELTTASDFTNLGLYPLRAKGLVGILTSPLIHADLKHLINNTFPLLILAWSTFFFYKEVALKVFFLTWLIANFWLWFFARDAYHIGASGIIYGLGSFLFFGGIFRRNKNLLAISLLITFLYGSMIWGIFPMEERISWESHLLGTVVGIILAIYYKDHGPPLPLQLTSELDAEENDEVEDEAMRNYNEYLKMKDENLPDEP